MDKHVGIQQRWKRKKLREVRKRSEIDISKYNDIVVEDQPQTVEHEYKSDIRGSHSEQCRRGGNAAVLSSVVFQLCQCGQRQQGFRYHVGAVQQQDAAAQTSLSDLQPKQEDGRH